MIIDSWEGRSPTSEELGYHFLKAMIYALICMPFNEGLITGMQKRAQNWEVLKVLFIDEQDFHFI
jgi:hypothetical protein